MAMSKQDELNKAILEAAISIAKRIGHIYCSDSDVASLRQKAEVLKLLNFKWNLEYTE